MPHEWDKNTPSEGLSTCHKCGLEVKTYRIRKGGLPTCDEFTQQQQETPQKQSKLNEKPPCHTDKTALACLKCPGRLDINLCKTLLKRLNPQKTPQTPKPPQKTEKKPPGLIG